MKKKNLVINNIKGAALVEFAIILPLLILLLFGIIEFGLLLFNQQVITNSSREGARFGIVVREDRFANDADIDEVEQVVLDWINNKLITFGDTTDSLNITIELWNSPNPEDAGAYAEAKSITDPDDRCTSFQCPLRIKVSYDYDFLVLSNLGFGPITLDATTLMKME